MKFLSSLILGLSLLATPALADECQSKLSVVEQIVPASLNPKFELVKLSGLRADAFVETVKETHDYDYKQHGEFNSVVVLFARSDGNNEDDDNAVVGLEKDDCIFFYHRVSAPLVRQVLLAVMKKVVNN